MSATPWLVLVVLGTTLGITYGMANELKDYKDHPCRRRCEDNAPPQTCKYHFLVENYYTMSRACQDCPFNQSHCFLPQCVAADGVQRGIKTANRILPGPSIQVCEGDTIEVTVENRMEASESTSIHWHGILQRGSQHMDGVALVTQCPISPHSRFTYRFKAQDVGTHFWHAHAGIQRADGLFGSVIVRSPPGREPHFKLYDHDLPEHVIIVTDWLEKTSLEKFVSHQHGDEDHSPELMLINGMGQRREFKDGMGNTSFTPRATFKVQGGKRYRFRIISSAVMNCPIEISIDHHNLTLIASDGNPFKPFVVDSFSIFAGERIDFVLHAHFIVTPKNFWMRVRGIADCGDNFLTQTAILKYEGAPDELPKEDVTWENSAREGIRFNPWNQRGTDSLVEMSRMESVSPDDETMKSEPDKRIYLAMDFNRIDNPKYTQPKFNPTMSVEMEGEGSKSTTSKPGGSGGGTVHHEGHVLGMAMEDGIDNDGGIDDGMDDGMTDEMDDMEDLSNGTGGGMDDQMMGDMDHASHGGMTGTGQEMSEGMDHATMEMHLYTPQMNHISLMLPPSPPLSQYDDIPEAMYCNAESLNQPCDKEFCTCIHRYQVSLGDVVELVVIDEGKDFDMNHPIHLHGHRFRVMGMDRLNTSTTIQEIKKLDSQGKLPRKASKAPYKDTVTVPDGGYTIIRFKADNPGFWFFHCHIEFHVEVGMSILFQSGTKEQMPKPPKGFPVCGDWENNDISIKALQCDGGKNAAPFSYKTMFVGWLMVIGFLTYLWGIDG